MTLKTLKEYLSDRFGHLDKGATFVVYGRDVYVRSQDLSETYLGRIPDDLEILYIQSTITLDGEVYPLSYPIVCSSTLKDAIERVLRVDPVSGSLDVIWISDDSATPNTKLSSRESVLSSTAIVAE